MAKVNRTLRMPGLGLTKAALPMGSSVKKGGGEIDRIGHYKMWGRCFFPGKISILSANRSIAMKAYHYFSFLMWGASDFTERGGINTN
ncbi:hypothetical protein ACT29H_13805 [Thermophagus sp. OGC60D27]|uniref:hypothetical protein n=1 Tax=Thermophagus sp. OGC60D27 TaxID=3458415 RepID=UPI004037D2E4